MLLSSATTSSVLVGFAGLLNRFLLPVDAVDLGDSFWTCSDSVSSLGSLTVGLACFSEMKMFVQLTKHVTYSIGQ